MKKGKDIISPRHLIEAFKIFYDGDWYEEQNDYPDLMRATQYLNDIITNYYKG